LLICSFVLFKFANMKKAFTLILFLLTACVYGQGYRLKTGNRFPDLVFRTLINAPINELDLNRTQGKKLYILNNWGTWCGPCIPEMEMLAKLQTQYDQQIQIIGVSDDSAEKLKNFVLKRPSKIWFVSDTASLLYDMLNISSVGQSAILDAKHRVIALVKTDSINSTMINKLLNGKQVASNAEVKVKTDDNPKDAFGVDTLTTSSFTIRQYMNGQQSMGRVPNKGVYGKRRVSYYNVGLVSLYKTAYEIVSQKQVIYEIDKKKYDNYQDKSQLYCFDLLVTPEQKDSLYLMMQKKLAENLPVKARTEMRTMPVYLLKTKAGTTVNMLESKPGTRTFSFDGNGFNGKEISMSEFALMYLSNEVELPVIDETGLTKLYDIKTNNDTRDKSNIMAAVNNLGLTLEKTERPVKVLVLYQ
jgi:uncharacterized protein (TIGR03435 family)